MLAQVGEAIALNGAGDRAAAHAHLTRLWEDTGPDGDPLHRLAIAHTMADCVPDPDEVVRWDERALAAAAAVTDERVRAAGIAGSIAAFYPSLHLNLGEAYRRVGDRARATAHLTRGRAALAHLLADGARDLLAEALDRLEARLAAASAPQAR